ncbi:unnamed protein product [Cuscuta europaea]|uniref:Transmembrane protein n=1 Tax=Cuscuta europaea TaxID=41803 RepID=A0A9P0Z2T7_CUSEU|nr:unnamed protein product [Cuscuta europaea]
MMSSMKFQLYPASLSLASGRALAGCCQLLSPRLHKQRRFASLSVQSENASWSEQFDQSPLTSTAVSSPAIQPLQLVLTPRHIQLLSFFTCTAAISATWLFCSAIPTLLALNKAATSLEKLMDAMREELPETMAAVRLSGMEISDLTMELSDLGQELTQGVRGSTRAVRLAGERLQQLTNIAPSATTQGVTRMQPKTAGPALARSLTGNIREEIVKGRAFFEMLFTLSWYFGLAFKFFKRRAKMGNDGTNI